MVETLSGELLSGMIVKFVGSTAGAVLALLRFPPKTRGEMARRMATSIISGMVAGTVVAGRLGLSQDWESALFASALTAFLSWGALGVIDRLPSKWLGKQIGKDDA